MGYRISTPIIVMQSELSEFPIIIRFQLMSNKFFIITFQSVCHPIFPILNRLANILRYSEPKLDQIKNFLLLKSIKDLLATNQESSILPHLYNFFSYIHPCSSSHLLIYPSVSLLTIVRTQNLFLIPSFPVIMLIIHIFILMGLRRPILQWALPSIPPFWIWKCKLGSLSMHPYLLRRLWLFVNLSNISLKKKSLSPLFSLMLRVYCRLLLVSQHCPLLHSCFLSFETFYILFIALHGEKWILKSRYSNRRYSSIISRY